ncbi:sigma-70 family RNA polymerase sigma factor [bacterium]|nr:sigma-70 family RNA polymerase sigma factor [bacterium]
MSKNGQIDDLDLLRNSLGGSEEGLNEVLMKHRERLRRMIALRMNDKLQGRLDASDVIQDTFVEASRALDAYLANPKLPVFLWLRHLAGEKLIQAHRKHLGAQKRTAEREQRIWGGTPAATSMSLAIQLAGKMTTPSKIAAKNEATDQLMVALESMNEVDREILTLRHFEQLTSRETATVLDMNYEAVKKRYVRALAKLQTILIGNGG